MIQPLETNSFIATDRTVYEEAGTVLEGVEELIGKQVLFDSWLAKKIKIKGKEMWFVKEEDLIAYGEVSE